jgi:hypothetical protein
MLRGHLPGDQPDFLLTSAADDGRDLLAAAMSDWDRRIPDCPAWTFSSRGDHRVGWWHRRLAVEIAIHRWDIQYATAASTEMPPGSIDGLVAAAWIAEFLSEFLPGLLETADPRVREGLGGSLACGHGDPRQLLGPAALAHQPAPLTGTGDPRPG